MTKRFAKVTRKLFFDANCVASESFVVELFEQCLVSKGVGQFHSLAAAQSWVQAHNAEVMEVE